MTQKATWFTMLCEFHLVVWLKSPATAFVVGNLSNPFYAEILYEPHPAAALGSK